MLEKDKQFERSRGPSGDSDGSGSAPLLGRRPWLKASSGLLASALGLSVAGQVSAAAARHGIQFDTVLDAVDDLGCDPTGEEPCHELIESGARDGALLYFPDGEYKMGESGDVLHIDLFDYDTIGLYSDEGATFVVPDETKVEFHQQREGNTLFEGINADQTAPLARWNLKVSAHDRLHVQDVTVSGMTDAQAAGSRGYKLIPLALDSSAEGIVKRFTAKDGGTAASYKDGGGGMWAGPPNKGRLQFVDCNVQGHPNNGLYAGRSEGPIQIKGGLWKNNEVSQVRLSGADSFVENADIIVDDHRETLNQRGVWWDGAKQEKTGGEIRNCNIQIRNVNKCQGAVRVWATAGACTVKNTYIKVNESRWDGQTVAAIHAETPDGGGFAPPPEPHSIAVKNVTIEASNGETRHEGRYETGAALEATVSIVDRPGSTVENTCVLQEGADRDGILFLRSDGAVRNALIDVTREEIVAIDSDVETLAIRETGECGSHDDGASPPPSE